VTAAGVGYVAALVLAATFAAAAVAKLRDRDGTQRSFEALGVPDAAAASRLLPLPELAVVVLLAVVPVAGALAVLVLLAFFTTFLVGRLRAGVDAPCSCFGSASSSPLSWVAVARNLGLAALAVAALLATRPVVPTVADVAVVVGATLVGAVAIRLAEHRVGERRPVA
jgi:hypothetical protein